MNNKYLYNKIFRLTPYLSLTLKNNKLLNDFNDEKIDELISAKDLKEASTIIKNIYNEVFRIIKHDLKCSDIPPLIGTFKDKDEENVFISNYLTNFDLRCYIGNILCNYHKFLFENKKESVIKLEDLKFINSLDLKELYYSALNDYAIALLNNDYPNPLNLPREREAIANDVYIEFINNNGVEEFPVECSVEDTSKKIITNKHAYTASFILPVIIERSLIIQSYAKIIRESLAVISEKIKIGEINLNDQEKKLFDILIVPGNKTFSYDFRDDLYSLLVKYNAIEDNLNIKSLVYGEHFYLDKKGNICRKKLTLGNLLSNKCFKSMLDDTYFKLIDKLFSANKMNLRNNMIHLNNVYYDYTDIAITSILIQLFWDIVDWNIFK